MSAVLENCVSSISTRRMSNMVDKLGDINAQISRLQDEADSIKGILKGLGMDEVYGKMFRAVISTSTSVRLDQKLVKGMLSASQIMQASVTSTSTRISLYDL